MSTQILYTGKGKAGDLLDPNNWDGGVVPGADSFAEITMNVGAAIGGTVEVENIMLLGSEQITFTGTLDTTGALDLCYGLYVCVGAGAIFAPGAVLNDPGVLVAGNGAAGTFLAEGSGSTHSVINSAVGKLGCLAAGVGTMTFNDSIWNNTGGVWIGYLGKGTLDVTNGASVNIGGNVWMANYAGSAGAMNISNGGSVTVDGLIYAGLRGSTSVASISVGSGSSLTADGFLLINTGSELTLNGGTVTAGESGSSAANRVETAAGGLISGYGTLNSPEPDGVGIMDNGTIVATGGTLDITSNINGGGTLEIAANSTAMVTGATLHMPSIAFIGSDATLGLTHGSSVSSTISGFSPGDVITMEDISAVSFNPSNGVLTLSENGKFVESLHFAGSFTGDTFAVHQVGGGLAAITLQHG